MKSLVIEKITTEVYNILDHRRLKELEGIFFKVYSNHLLFMDWLLFDNEDASIRETINSIHFSNQEKAYIEKAFASYVAVYEVYDIANEELFLRDVFTRFTLKLRKTEIEDEIEKYDLVIARLYRSKESKRIGSTAIILPCQFKTMLVGRIVEEYHKGKVLYGHYSYEEFFKRSHIKVLEVVRGLTSYHNVTADITLFQSTYAVKNYNSVKEGLTNIASKKEVDGGEIVFSLIDNGNKVAEILLSNKLLEVECKNKTDRRKAKKQLEEKLTNSIQHIKDEELTIDDII